MSALYPPFQTVKKCPKCGGSSFTSKFQEGSVCEFIIRECKECKYQFRETPLDWVEEEPEELLDKGLEKLGESK